MHAQQPNTVFGSSQLSTTVHESSQQSTDTLGSSQKYTVLGSRQPTDVSQQYEISKAVSSDQTGRGKAESRTLTLIL